MTLQSQKHILLHDDIANVESIGFDIENHTAIPPEDFLNEHFANFDIAGFLSEINGLLIPLCTFNSHKSVSLENPPPELWLRFFAEKEDVVFVRKFFYENDILCVSHEYLILPVSSRGKGLARLIFRPSLQQYVNMGVGKIVVHAGLETGGYTWARNGFTANNKDEINLILEKAKNRLSDVQYNAVLRVYNNYYGANPGGTAFQIIKWAEMRFMKDVLLGADWQGTMDLSDSEQFSNFINYVFE
jgi:hypothetical protein